MPKVCQLLMPQYSYKNVVPVQHQNWQTLALDTSLFFIIANQILLSQLKLLFHFYYIHK